jgi:signal transduction histidine kinase
MRVTRVLHHCAHDPTYPLVTPTRTTAAARGAGADTGEMRRLVREHDWARTPLGAVEGWPETLRLAVDMVLGSGFPQMVLWGPELAQVYNDAYGRLAGDKHPAALGQPLRDFWPQLWAVNGPLFERAWRGETVHLENARYEFSLDGERTEERFYTSSYSPIHDADGAVVGLFVTLVETTLVVRTQEMQADRERLVRELQRERNRLEDVFRQAPTFLAILHGPEHVFQLVNDAYYQVVGHRDLIGKRAAEAIPEVIEQGFIGLLDEVLRTGKPFIGRELPVMLQREAGGALEERFLDFVYQPLTEADGSRAGIVAHGSDVTDQVLARRKVEEVNIQLEERAAELRASEQRLRDLFAQAPVAVAVMEGPEHVYTIASPRYVATPGSGRPLIGRSVLEAFPEVKDQGYIETMDRVFQTGIPYFANERLVKLDRDGDGVMEDYWFNVGYQPLRDASGTVYAIASVAYEVTDQMRARRELEIAQESAENARVEAVTANQAKSAFLTTMSHELRTPLNAVAGYADLLLMEVRGPLTEGQRTDLERIKRSGQYLLGLINDVLNFAKLDSGQVEYRFETVRVAPLLEGLEELIRPQVDAKGLHYEKHHGADQALTVRADPEKLRQILLNLLANAVKFTEPGGRVTLSCTADAEQVRMTVSDSGRGIAADQLSRVFDPFVQVDRHLTPMSQQGVGLGLAISRDLANGMGGNLEAKSEPGVGSEFTVSLPRGF